MQDRCLPRKGKRVFSVFVHRIEIFSVFVHIIGIFSVHVHRNGFLCMYTELEVMDLSRFNSGFRSYLTAASAASNAATTAAAAAAASAAWNAFQDSILVYGCILLL